MKQREITCDGQMLQCRPLRGGRGLKLPVISAGFKLRVVVAPCAGGVD